MKKPPAGWPRISPAIFYDDADATGRPFGYSTVSAGEAMQQTAERRFALRHAVARS